VKPFQTFLQFDGNGFLFLPLMHESLRQHSFVLNRIYYPCTG